MFYDRKIKYLDYIENGQRLRNGGFVKFEVRENKCCITLQISGLRTMEQHSCKVYFIGAKKQEVFCEIPLQQGRGSVQLYAVRENLCGGIAYEQLETVVIPVSMGRELRCTVAEKRPEAAIDVREKVEIEAKPDDEEEISWKPIPEALGEMQRQKRREDPGEMQEEEKQEEPGEVQKEEKQEESPKIQQNAMTDFTAESHSLPTTLLEDKWKQLSAIYPHICPFQDEREYLSVGPGDFVILSRKYYKLVNNSFLLHGFYNYKHLILTCMEVKGEKHYYMGVPGNFYEREKQVAIMFGFESFECREEPAEMGDFGYYMMRVEI